MSDHPLSATEELEKYEFMEKLQNLMLELPQNVAILTEMEEINSHTDKIGMSLIPKVRVAVPVGN